MVATILSGGNNRRMLRDKAVVQIGQKAIIERESEVLSTLLTRIIVETNATDINAHLAAELARDLTPGIGPLGGIYSGLIASDDDH